VSEDIHALLTKDSRVTLCTACNEKAYSLQGFHSVDTKHSNSA